MTAWSLAVEVSRVSKRYNELLALDRVSLAVCMGEVVALLGPNGAGKTSLLEIIEGLREPSAGSAKLLGEDAANLSSSARSAIGVQLQNPKSSSRIKAGELMHLMTVAYGRNVDSGGLLDLVGLRSKSNGMLSRLSVGQQQRLAFGAALAGNPKLLILDEPTSNLDPQSRRLVWAEIRRRANLGAAVLFATHQIDEAEQFCDRVVIIDHGRVIEEGKPSHLVDLHCPGYEVVIQVQESDMERCRKEAARLALNEMERDPCTLSWNSEGLDAALAAIVAIMNSGVAMTNLGLKRRSLEDVFIHLTGESLRD